MGDVLCHCLREIMYLDSNEDMICQYRNIRMIVLIGSFNYLSCWFLQVLVNQYGIYFTTVCVSTFPAGSFGWESFQCLKVERLGGRLFNGVWFTSSTTMNSPSDPMDLKPWNRHLRWTRNIRRLLWDCHHWMHSWTWMPMFKFGDWWHEAKILWNCHLMTRT